MLVKGNHEFKIKREQLWSYLMDPEVLAKITPGVSKLEVTDKDAYNTISDIKIGPVKGSFKGKLKVEDKNEPVSFIINMEQLSKIGNAHGKIVMQIDETENANSKLSFDGNVKLSGMVARTGQRVLSGVANVITKEVFAALEEHIAENPPTEEVQAVQKEEIAVVSEFSNADKPTEQASKDVDSKSHQISISDEKIVEETHVVKAEPLLEDKFDSPKGFIAAIIRFFKSLFGT